MCIRDRLAQGLKEQGFEICSLSGVELWDDIWSKSEDIYKELKNVFIQKPTEKWQQLLDKWDIPAEPILTLEEAIKDEQIITRGYYTSTSENSEVRLPSAPFQMSQGGPVINRAPPTLGQDSREILRAIGMNENEIDLLFLERIVE